MSGSDAEFESQRARLALMLERESRRRSGGAEGAAGAGAAARIVMSTDPMVQRAVAVLARATQPDHVFALAKVAAPRKGHKPIEAPR